MRGKKRYSSQERVQKLNRNRVEKYTNDPDGAQWNTLLTQPVGQDTKEEKQLYFSKNNYILIMEKNDTDKSRPNTFFWQKKNVKQKFFFINQISSLIIKLHYCD